MTSLIDIVADARRDRVVVDAPTDGAETLADSYDIQARLFGDFVPAGYKLGLTSPAKRAQMGHDRPVYGRVSREMIRDEAIINLGCLIQPRFEPEVAVILASNIRPNPLPGEVTRAIGSAFLALDVLDSIWSGYRFSLAQVVADNVSGGAFVLGQRAYPTIPSGSLTALLDGNPVASGGLSEIGDPIGYLGWLATDNGGLVAGQVIFLGSPVAAADARPGLLEIEGPEGYTLVVRFVEGV
jgi:2-oxo-3-hexenedioate decarboxylase